MLVMVTGGARSGKSAFAEQYASCLGGSGMYVATAQIYDEEMQERVGRHQEQRAASGFPWTTVEEPYDLPGILRQEQSSAQVMLVDCLTLWLSNWLLRYEQEADAESRVTVQIDELLQALKQRREKESPPGNDSTPILLVTNEVGNGIVPEYKLGRQFRDLSGRLNQRLAAICDQVFLVTAGIPIELKRHAFTLPKVGEA